MKKLLFTLLAVLFLFVPSAISAPADPNDPFWTANGDNPNFWIDINRDSPDSPEILYEINSNVRKLTQTTGWRYFIDSISIRWNMNGSCDDPNVNLLPGATLTSFFFTSPPQLAMQGAEFKTFSAIRYMRNIYSNVWFSNTVTVTIHGYKYKIVGQRMPDGSYGYSLIAGSWSWEHSNFFVLGYNRSNFPFILNPFDPHYVVEHGWYAEPTPINFPY